MTAEVTPHHLLLTEELVRGYDARYKVNPPLRREEDVLAVREGLADGTIDIVATDHAPHPRRRRRASGPRPRTAWSGLESALRVVQMAVVDTGLLRGRTSRACMSETPARIGLLAGHGTPLEAGQPAALTLYDPSPTRVFSASDLHGRSLNSPYLGAELPGACAGRSTGVLRPSPTVCSRSTGVPA